MVTAALVDLFFLFSPLFHPGSKPFLFPAAAPPSYVASSARFRLLSRRKRATCPNQAVIFLSLFFSLQIFFFAEK